MMKYVYVLISEIRDVYYEQAFISMTSLKIHTPNAFISLLIDKETIESIKNRKADIRKLADEVIVENFDSSVDNKKRSRILKTIMRNRIDGDFLYIDGDTIICEDLNEIEHLKLDLGAVLDLHMMRFVNLYELSYRTKQKILLNNKRFYNYSYLFNGGLLFVRDTELNRKFFEKWNENYLIGCEKGITTDMPSLGLTDFQLDFPIKEIDGKWNVQIWYGANYLRNAKIIHYFGSDSTIEYEPFSNILPMKIKEVGYLTENDLSLLAKPNGNFGKETCIITGNDYDMYRSNVFILLRKLNKCKFLFKLLDKILAIFVIRGIEKQIRKEKK